jgi:hypothetical protein
MKDTSCVGGRPARLHSARGSRGRAGRQALGGRRAPSECLADITFQAALCSAGPALVEAVMDVNEKPAKPVELKA